jgi:hypothetical protein
MKVKHIETGEPREFAAEVWAHLSKTVKAEYTQFVEPVPVEVKHLTSKVKGSDPELDSITEK